MDVFDTIVVGAGIEGSATAYQLAKANKSTLLLEQFLLPHTRGSSHGQSRIIRKAYEQAHYAAMMNEAYEMWHTLEQESCIKLFQQTGLLVVARPPQEKYIDACEKALAASGTIYQRLTAEQINKQFPMMKFDPGDLGVFEKDAGVLFADKCLQAFHKMFIHYGGKLQDGEPVTTIIPGSVVTVETPKGSYKARSIVITAGPWTSKVLKPLGLTLPLQVVRINVCYWPQQKPNYRLDGFPAFAVINMPNKGKNKQFMYGIPSIEYPGHIKFCNHHSHQVDPDLPDTYVRDEEDLKVVVGKHLPYLLPNPSIIEKCLYTMTPDEEFVLDRHPKYQNIIVGAGFSGHGFKLAPMVGRLLSQLASNQEPHENMKPFKIDRFNQLKANL